MKLLTVDQELCIKCGMCAEVCPNRIIGMTDKGPEMRFAPACIGCGHCTAICPKTALEHKKAPVAKQIRLEHYPVLDPQMAAKFLRSRRSIRCYKKDKITKKTIQELLNIARFAPSGCNSQGLSYIVIANTANLEKIVEATVVWLETQIQSGAVWAKDFAGVTDFYRKTGIDVILRDAPCLIVATAPSDFSMGHDNARFSLEYVELYATALGLGTCWAGFVEAAAGAKDKNVLTAMEIPQDTAVVGAMMLGYPQYTYQRLVDRNPLQVTWVE